MPQIIELKEKDIEEYLNKIYSELALFKETYFYLPVKKINNDYEVKFYEYCFLCDNNKAINVNLPSAKRLDGKEYIFVKISPGNVPITIRAKPSEFINGGRTVILNRQWQRIKIISDGTNWIIINE